MKLQSALAILAFFVLTSCGNRNDALNSDEVLKNKIHDAVQSGQPILDLENVADFQWDSLIILTPYANTKALSDSLKVDLSSTKNSGIEESEVIDVLVFFSKGNLIRMLVYPRKYGDFVNTRIEFMKRNNAKFDIVITDKLSSTGYKWYELRKR